MEGDSGEGHSGEGRSGWWTETPDLFSAALGRANIWWFFIVERLPDGGWDWVAWAKGAESHPVCGVADSALNAMLAAERAAGFAQAAAASFWPNLFPA